MLTPDIHHVIHFYIRLENTAGLNSSAIEAKARDYTSCYLKPEYLKELKIKKPAVYRAGSKT
jgi:hypothetical protein